MLSLITGLAGSGKTALMMDAVRSLAERGEKSVLIVPEQYSHEAERELCAVAGDSLSLYAEVLSFTGLARRVEEELGSGGLTALDKGGRLLCMALALSAVGERLSVYGAARRSPELQQSLLSELDELKSAMVTPEELMEASALCGGSLSRKLSDLAIILGAYDAAVGAERRDLSDTLSLLLRRLPQSAFGRGAHIFIDGFTDFTAQESAVIKELMCRAEDVTVCLTLDDITEGDEVFELPRRTARRLMRDAEELGVPVERKLLRDEGERGPIDSLCAHLFDYSGGERDALGAVELYAAGSVSAECELAAARAIRLVRDGGCRWRDIALAVRGFGEYESALQSAFSYYGVPLFTAKRSDILSKPVPTLISSAYAILLGGWEAEDVFSYLRTGLAGLTQDECDILENYCVIWDAKAPMWLSPKDWRAHPAGYGEPFDDAVRARLEEINALRRRAAAPLISLAEAMERAATAREQATALCALFDELKLPEKLAKRSDELEANGRGQSAAEYEQLWRIAVSALEQFVDILGDAPMDAETFSRLFLLTLSQYDVGLIPVTLDAVTAGDFDRMRRRHIKHLLVLGASDERLPAPGAPTGIFTDEERRTLTGLGLELDAGDAELWREFTLIYNCLSLPSQTLTLITPSFGSDGAPVRPSFVINRAARLFSLTLTAADARDYKRDAPGPALELAAMAERRPQDALLKEAEEYFKKTDGERLRSLRSAASMERGSLSREAVTGLYGERLRLSASRIDKFASCRFAYFIQYGLKAKPRRKAEFSPPEFGTFMHYILQNVASEAAGAGGFASVSDKALAELADKYTSQYIHDELNDFEDKSPRFRYLFTRLAGNVRRVVRDMAEELRCGRFEPLSFELDFASLRGKNTVPLPEGGGVELTGVADRVDGWVRGDTLYLRVVDYKTGKKSFSLSDVRYGMGLQMLLYLFTLQKNGQELYGRRVAPAGVLYVPAWDRVISALSDMPDEEIEKKRKGEHTRSGLVLADAEVLRAMEDTDAPVRLPVKWKDGVPTGDSLASAEQLGLLGRRIEETLASMAGELRGGSIAADPYYRAAQDYACLHCDYFDACRFTDGQGGEKCRYIKKLPASEVWSMMEGGAN